MTVPRASIRASSVSNARPPSVTDLPSARSSRRCATTLKRPNSRTAKGSRSPSIAGHCTEPFQEFSGRFRNGRHRRQHTQHLQNDSGRGKESSASGAYRGLYEGSRRRRRGGRGMRTPRARGDGVEQNIQKFLKALAAGAGKSIEEGGRVWSCVI